MGLNGMKCPKCYHKHSRVLDSRPIEDGDAIRRRRECERCGFRIRTYERKEETPLIIVKKDGTRQEFNRDKLIRGLMRACEERPVTIEEIEQIALEDEREMRQSKRTRRTSQTAAERECHR